MKGQNKILVTGASGQVGHLILNNLIAADLPVRASSRNPEAAKFPDRVEVVKADITKPETLRAAFDEVTKVFLYANPEGIHGFLKEASNAGIKHIVLLSSSAVVYGDADNFIAKRHILVEQAIVESGIPYTFLRPGSFASNALFWRKQIKNENIVRYPYPLSQSAPIHEADIAEVATNVLTSSGFEGMTPLLTGPESITQLRQVELIGEVTEREIIFEEMNPEQAVAEMSSYLPSQVAEILVKVLKRNNGKPALISDEVEKITGRTARSFSEWVWEHRNEFIS